MPFSTVFTCNNVELSSTPRLGLPGGHDNWHSVRIAVHEMGLRNRWIYIEMTGNTALAPPFVHMALSEGWDLTCDERAMTLVLEGEDATTRLTAIHKLRFNKVADFWSFVYEVSLSRVREYNTRDRRAGSQVSSIRA